MPYTKTPQRAWREVDLTALRRHFFLLRALAPNARICPVLKANAYGHGARHLALLYEELGAHALALATLDEALSLRDSGVRVPLLLLGHTDPFAARTLARHRIIPAIHSPASAKEYSRAAQRAGVMLPVQIKIDTGMGRLGFVAKEGREAACARAVLAAAHLPNLHAVGIFTHFSSADESGVGLEYTKKQLRRFLVVRDLLARAGLPLPAHAANSAATLTLPESHLDMIRPGLALYGISPLWERESRSSLADCSKECLPCGKGGVAAGDAGIGAYDGGICARDFSPALTVKATVAQVRWAGRGEAIGYGRTYLAPRKMRVATLAIGYGDGLCRRQSEVGGGVEVAGQKSNSASPFTTHAPRQNPLFLPFVGRISMDQCTVDATAAPWLQVGDSVTVLGGTGHVSFAAAASREGTIPYELLTRLSARLSIVYEN